ncbi:MAG TPA: glucokinase [Candidatus Sericytochromatia bacterium]
MTLLLAGDIGGTKTNLRLVQVVEEGKLNTLYQEIFSSRKYSDLLPLVQQFLATASQHLGEEQKPEKACFAIAGPIVDNTSVLPNLGWSLNAKSLEQHLGIKPISFINDFAAVGYGILGLSASETHTLQAGKRDPNAPICVIGAGTGLGEGFLIPQADSYQVFATEGGHSDFAPRSELEFNFLKYLLDKHNIERVSYDRVVSGRGIIALYQFLRDRPFAEESLEIAKIMRQWEAEAGQIEKTVDPAAVISKAALEKSDRLCQQTMQMFLEIYGAEAGNFALKLLPYGGVYIAGGVAAKNLPLLQDGTFIHAFNDKGRVSSVLEKMPVYVIVNQEVGLIGAALYAARL